AFCECIVITELCCLSKSFISVSVSLFLSLRQPTKVTTSCCTRVSDSHIKFRLQGYHIQNAMPPCVDAIVQPYCSSPATQTLNTTAPHDL
uniref:Uncharacterized protein n=1 Tax=Oncorhynchus tshawytscha TaxID=74940 RepID=A0A8C8ETT9_ONCTS